MIERRKIKKAVAYAMLLCFTSLTGAQPLYAIPANTQLPTGPNGTVGTPISNGALVEITHGNNQMTITQNGQTSVLEWGNFSIGADATVNFVGQDGQTFNGLNSLNYVKNGGPVSEIYGQLNALGGNIFIANPAGVQIGNSAQINVGSLYVTNKDIGKAIEDGLISITKDTNTQDITSALQGQKIAATNAELMSLGSIISTENKVTFDGGRIVIDADRLYTDSNGTKMMDGNAIAGLTVHTNDADNVVIGYSAYSEGKNKNTYAGKNKTFTLNENSTANDVQGYMWVEDAEQLQAMNTNLSGRYALRNSIDANATADYNDGAGFDPIGGTTGGQFTGRFDGLGYSIFGLTIDRPDETYVGMFGSVGNGAYIGNFTLNSGSITGQSYVGSAVGAASGGALIENITNTTAVSGKNSVGGIIGWANSATMSGLINTGAVTGESANIGGIVGNMYGGSLVGTTYNLGSVIGGSNVGGIVGHSYGASIGSDAFQIYNQLNVTGQYNVGGVAGSLEDSTVTNAANYGNVTANSWTEDTYSYHTAETDKDSTYLNGAELTNTGTGNVASIAVNAANAGGIAGKSDCGTIKGVTNEGNVTAKTAGADNHYTAGNVGGIVGRAEDTKITNAENKENTVAGAHNVGGIAGYLGGESLISDGVNNGGDITATGARKYRDTGFATEYVRANTEAKEQFIIGNIGGIAGYVEGDNAKVTNSGNRGTVHTAEITGDVVPETAKAANAGGVVGKIDSGTADTLASIKGDYGEATVSNSYNTGDVQGYTGVGGVVGMMYNGSVAKSYNLGSVKTTRQVTASGGSNIEPLNMGGVVGDTTEQTDAKAVIYDVYNAGKIGDDTFTYFARHVGGVVGRLSGHLEKAYNTGDIYNKDTTVGGVVGWWYNGDIKDVFNTGNVTVRSDTELQVGGIVGASETTAGTLSYAYNLGTIRGFSDSRIQDIYVGGIIGRARGGNATKISDVYTLGNLYAARTNNNSGYTSVGSDDGLGAIYGGSDAPNLSNANYITPETSGTGNNYFTDLTTPAENQGINVVAYNDRDNAAYNLDGLKKLDGDNWSVNSGAWRVYEDGTPILNAFTPHMANNEEWKGLFESTDGATVQYGTAYNPLLTILDIEGATIAGDDLGSLTFNWSDLGLTSAGGLAVYGGGLTLNGFTTDDAGRYFGGTLYSSGALAVNGLGNSGYFNLGSAAQLYGSSVTLDAKGGDVTFYGSVTSTNGGITINGGDVEILGSLTASKTGESTTISGIAAGAEIKHEDTSGLSNPNKAMTPVSDMHSLTVKGENNGSITVNAQGDAEILYGNLGTGSVSAGGDFSVTSEKGSVKVDSDVSGVNGNISLKADGEALLDITNVAKANAGENDQNGTDALHAFLNRYGDGGNTITLQSETDDEIIAIDMWDGSAFNLNKYNKADGTELSGALSKLNLGDGLKAEDAVHIWVGDAEQLKGIQAYAEERPGSQILNYNFALKDNIDASALTGYESIGKDATNGFSGVFDGRGFRIIGLTANGADNAGIFDMIGENGTVRDLRVYSSTFNGNANAGAIAGINKGTITGVTTFGNHVEAAGAAGGITGTNSGAITASTASDSVIAKGDKASAGGVAGVNEKGANIGSNGSQITADSAVTSSNGAAALGGVVGDNSGSVLLANSLGVTNGENADNIGGIAGVNSGTMTSLYNESIVTGENSTGGVAGTNSGTINNAVNATSVTGTGKNTGGLVGDNSGTVDSGRNAGAVTGVESVGGMVGHNNGKDAALKNLSNAINASITGKTNVGGIAGVNDGTINNENALVNEGTVKGTTNVGGIAGTNEGTIQNVNNQTLVLETDGAESKFFGGIAGVNNGTITDATNTSSVTAEGAKFVGGIAGLNGEKGQLLGELTNEGSVTGKDSVGGLAGSNANKGLLVSETPGGITVTNKGEVYATVGSAGGIFYKNEGKIENVTLINANIVKGEGNEATGGLFGINIGEIVNSKLENTGTVTGGGTTGGLIGSNTGTVSGSELTNSGTVTGGKNTGGLIGSNSGNVSNSTLINEYGATVSGGENTGGLIGRNTGEITGGRDEGQNGMAYYADQIVNNGAVTGTGDNVGGLIGNNAKDAETGKIGSLTAGYNTGAVTGDSNVGGIVGNNAGTVSEVFNTVMTAGEKGAPGKVTEEIRGASNVGGLIGNNSGPLKDAYNTTAVTATNGTKGNAVGTNSGTITNVYATNADGNLIGETTGDGKAQNVYTFATGDDSAKPITGGEQKQAASYGGFDFDGMWKIYEGYGAPLLKVFLTEARYDGETGLVQTGRPVGLPISGVTAGDNLAAYRADNSLLVALKNAGVGDGYLAFMSQQIAWSGADETFNPNWLGYDIDATYNIKPNPAMLLTQNNGHLHWLHRGGERHRNFRERKAEIYFHEGGMIHE